MKIRNRKTLVVPERFSIIIPKNVAVDGTL